MRFAEVTFDKKFWALVPAINLNFHGGFTFEFEWLCLGIYLTWFRDDLKNKMPEIPAEAMFMKQDTLIMYKGEFDHTPQITMKDHSVMVKARKYELVEKLAYQLDGIIDYRTYINRENTKTTVELRLLISKDQKPGDKMLRS